MPPNPAMPTPSCAATPTTPIVLAPLSNVLPLDDLLRGLGPAVRRVFVCDVYVDGIEGGAPIDGLSAGYWRNHSVDGRAFEVINIDHHAPGSTAPSSRPSSPRPRCACSRCQ